MIDGRNLSRENFYTWLWVEFTEKGLLGIHEGTLLTEQVVETGLETESWTIDAAEAPRERDWIDSQEEAENQLYFATLEDAQRAHDMLAGFSGLVVGKIEEQKVEDWDAQWKASFTGVFVPPCWDVLPPWVQESVPPGRILLRINPGAGFGTGTHETTQLCLGILVDAFSRAMTNKLLAGGNPRVLDFGSGSGILSIGAALLGGKVDGVEIDSLAIDNAIENAALNEIQDRVTFTKDFPPASEEHPGTYRIVVANILKPVLLQFAEVLVKKMDPVSDLILSGLMAPDVPAVSQAYSALLGGRFPEVRELGEWRALWWRSL